MTTEAETTPVPDCFFWRDRESEERGGYMLAGVLIVRRPWLSRSTAASPASTEDARISAFPARALLADR